MLRDESEDGVFSLPEIQDDDSLGYLGIVRALIGVDDCSGVGRDLLEHREAFGVLIDAKDEPMCVKDGESRWLIANRAMLETLGITGVDYIGKTNGELVAANPRIRNVVWDMDVTDRLAWMYREPLGYELPVDDIGGGRRRVDGVKIPVFNRVGNPCLLIEVGNKVSADSMRRIRHAHIQARGEAILSLMKTIDHIMSRIRNSPGLLHVITGIIPIFRATFGFSTFRFYSFHDTFYTTFFSDVPDGETPGFSCVQTSEYENFPPEIRRLLLSVDRTLVCPFINSSSGDDIAAQLCDMFHAQSLVAIPIEDRGETSGLLCIWNESPLRLSEKRQRVLSLAVEILTAACERIINRHSSREAARSAASKRAILDKSIDLATVGNMTATLAHDIRQPLTALRINVDSMLYMKELNRVIAPDELYGNLGFLVEQADRINSFLNVISDLSGCGRDDSRRVLSVNQHVRQVLDLADSCLMSRGIELRVRYDSRDPRIFANHTVLRHLILNMCVYLMTQLKKYASDKRIIHLSTFTDGPWCGVTFDSPVLDDEQLTCFVDGRLEIMPGNDVPLELVIVENLALEMNGSVRLSIGPEHKECYRIQLPCHTESGRE